MHQISILYLYSKFSKQSSVMKSHVKISKDKQQICQVIILVASLNICKAYQQDTLTHTIRHILSWSTITRHAFSWPPDTRRMEIFKRQISWQAYFMACHIINKFIILDPFKQRMDQRIINSRLGLNVSVSILVPRMFTKLAKVVLLLTSILFFYYKNSCKLSHII